MLLKRLAIHPDSNRLKRYLPFTPHQISAWSSRKGCRQSLVSLCRIQHPQQLTGAEVDTIRKQADETPLQHWPLASRYYHLLRQGLLHCSLSTFYKYCRLLHITQPAKQKIKNYEPLRAAAPLELLHMDVTIDKQIIPGVKTCLHVIRDNYSRVILGCKAVATCCSGSAKAVLEEVLAANGLLATTGKLLTDDGSENKGAVTEWLARPGMLWKKLVAQVDIVQSNSMAETANKILKHQFLQHLQFATLAELHAALPTILEAYNSRPLACLYGLTPNEVLQGAVPDKNRYAAQIAEAKQKRVAANQKLDCKLAC